ncbi:MAG: glycosyltransferase family 4 protein [Elusimicrobiota bacterium]
MNIVHLEDEPWDSGIAHYALTLAAEQVRRGHRVAFWGLQDSPILKQAAALGLPSRAWPPGPLGWAQIPALRKELAAFAPRIVNAHTGSSHALALMIAPRTAAVIRTRGDARPVQATSLTRWSAGRTAAFIAANSAIEAQLKEAFPKTPVRLVMQGIASPDEIAPMPGPPFVGMIARMDAVKGHGALIDAAQILKPSFPGLRVLCAGEGALLERLRWQLKPQGLEHVVRFLGRVEDKWAFMSGCRLGVVASLGSEAVSRAALEWMAAGRPLVATRVGGLADLVDDGFTGLLVPPGDARALAAAIKTVLDDPARAEMMGRTARERWEENFSLGPFYQGTLKVYDEAINSLSR